MKYLKLLIVFILLISLCGCGSTQNSAQKVSRVVMAMDTTMQLTVYGSEADLDACESLIKQLESEFSVTNENSDIYRLNRDGKAALSSDTAELLGKALSYCALTDGRLDISVYPVVKAWGFTQGEYRVPSQSEIDSLLPLVNYRNVSLTGTEAALTASGTQIDLGSVAKGYTGQRLVELLKSRGVTSALINLGGNVQVIGTKPDGTAWRIAPADPDGGSPKIALDVHDKALVTSGDYQRYFVQDGVTYHHIMDPATGYPANTGLRSVTIVGTDGTMCDALSTALFVMGKDEAVSFWKQNGGFEFVLISSDGSIYISEGLSSCCTALGSVTPQVVTHD